MRSKWTVGQQIAAGFAMVLVILALLVAMALRNTWQFMETSRWVAHTHEVLGHLEQLLSHLKDAETGQRGFVITGSESFLEPYNQASLNLARDVDSLRRLTQDNPAQQRRLAALQPLLDAKMEELRETIELRRGKGFDATRELVATGRGKQLMDNIRAVLAEMRAEEERLLRERERDSSEDSRLLTWTLEAGAVGALLFVVLAAFAIIRALRQQIGSAVEHVQSSSTELQAAAAQQASGAKEQASVTTEISTTMKELLSTSRQISGNAQQVTRMADETASAALSGTETMHRAQGAIDAVSRQVDVIVNHMLDLGKRSQEIGGILDIINELAEQTNILAINATIESAGAGEHGRRFGVVAEEIRKLADRVGSSTKDIRTLIDEIRAAANTTIMATEDGSKAVQNSARQFSELSSSLRRITELVRTHLEVAREIELSTQQQTSAVEQVTSAINDVAQTARQTETSSTQTLQTSVQLIQLARQLSALVDSRATA